MLLPLPPPGPSSWPREGHSEPAIDTRGGPCTTTTTTHAHSSHSALSSPCLLLPSAPPGSSCSSLGGRPVDTSIPLTSLCTSTTIPPAAIVKPQGFFARSFPPRGAAGVHIHLTLSHASYRLLTCPTAHRRSRTPAAYHHGRRSRHRNRHDGAHDPLCHWQHRHAAGVFLMSRWTPGATCPLGAAAEGGVGSRTAQPPHPPPPTPTASLNPPHTIHALTIPGPSPQGGQALLDHGIPKPHLLP